MMRFRINEAARTDTGRVRKVNEDSLLARGEAGLWAVADGMGGHEGGQWASRTVVEALAEAELAGDLAASVEIVAGKLHSANTQIFAAAEAAGHAIGSTAVVLILVDDGFAAIWAGDSRAYLLRDGRLVQLTTDHSQVQDMVARGLLTHQEAHRHPMSHVLTRAVGVAETLQLDAITDAVLKGDVFLLCSDGLTGLLEDQEIEAELASAPPAAACDRLLQHALERGAPDNVTLIALACQERTAVSGITA